MRLVIATLVAVLSLSAPAFAQVSGVTVDNTAPSNAAGARTTFAVAFTTSATGALSSAANSRIYVTFPAGTTFDGWRGGRVSVAGTEVGACYSPTNLVSDCYLYSAREITAGAQVTIAFAGVTNPEAAGPGKTVTVSTTADPQATASAPFAVVPGGTVSAATVAHGSPSAAAGARTRYTVAFTASATGGLAEDANSRISVSFPTGTTFNGWRGGRVSIAGTEVGACYSPANLVSDCYLYTDRTITPGANVSITFDGVTNPTAGAGKQLTVSTTSDPASVASANYTVVPAGTISAATVAHGSPSAAAGARTRYTVAFTASATGGLAEDANSRISVSFPTGTTFNGWRGGRVSIAGTEVGACYSPANLVSDCYLYTDRAIAPGANVSIAFAGVTNPQAVGPNKIVTVSTTSDPQAIASAPFAVVAGGTVSGVSVAAGSLAPAARTDYVVRLTTSQTGALANDANSELYFGFPAGSSFAGWGGGIVHDVATGLDVGACYSPANLVSECYLYSGRTVGATTQLRVTFKSVTNPAAAGPYRMTVSTTSDTPAVTSGSEQDTTRPPAAPSVSEAAAAVFAFGSGEPGVSFQCSLNNAAFTACTSPATYGGLAPGTHTFRVRAVNAAGLAGPASVRSFSVAAPQPPAPTPSPTPPPTPQFKRDVVVAPVSGTIKVCPKGPNRACTTLPAGSAIPMGSTVDARKGVVELASLAARGAAPQTARFSRGMFKVTQSGSTTNLTLNEPLDCSKKKKARKANVKKKQKKAKKRKLWGDGKGKFRTKGSYSAATVRGTKWLVEDTCTTTVTRVTQGVVSVRDSAKRKTITLRKGKRYVARAKKR